MKLKDTLMRTFGALVLLLVFVFGLSLILAFPVKWLWNSTGVELWPTVFQPIGVWMAWKISILFGLLVKSTNYSNKKSD